MSDFKTELAKRQTERDKGNIEHFDLKTYPVGHPEAPKGGMVLNVGYKPILNKPNEEIVEKP